MDKIYHYYLPDRAPFLSLSELKDGEENPIFKKLLTRHKHINGYNRRFGTNYLKTRKAVEEKLRCKFIERGGMPKRMFPIYFTLGKSAWFENFNAEHQIIEIPISELPLASVSITFPDSYITMTDQTKPYYEKVYFINEIEALTSKYGLAKDHAPNTYKRYWEGDFEHYYEVQVWDDEVLRKYLADY